MVETQTKQVSDHGRNKKCSRAEGGGKNGAGRNDKWWTGMERIKTTDEE